MSDHSKLTARRSGFVIRRGRRIPIEPAAAVNVAHEHFEAYGGVDSEEPAVVGAWSLCRAAWALDMGPVFLDGIGRLFDAPGSVAPGESVAWQQHLSDAVSDSCRGHKPELSIGDDSPVTAEEVRGGLLLLTETILDELGSHSAELAGMDGGSAEEWRRRYGQAVGWESNEPGT